MKNLFTPIPDRRYELKFFAEDSSCNSVAVFFDFYGANTGPGGQGTATSKKSAADYVYHMQFDGGRIKHMTKIWIDTISPQQLGWG